MGDVAGTGESQSHDDISVIDVSGDEESSEYGRRVGQRLRAIRRHQDRRDHRVLRKVRIRRSTSPAIRSTTCR